MDKKILKFIKENKILQYGDSVILGVSGGADSICMLHILCKLKKTLNLTLCVVHVNHGIRGEEAQDDEMFVKKTCDDLGIEFLAFHINVPDIVEKTGMTEEEAGRKERYQIFQSVLETYHADKIAVAHNLNDNSETILFNLFRGTGIKGLSGIPVKRGDIVRPLLCCTRDEIEKYLASNCVKYCNDMTNKSTEYTRNRIRLDVLPYIKENINKKAEYNIVSAAEKLSEISDYLQGQVNIEYDRYVRGNKLQIAAGRLHPAIRNQIVRRMIEREAGCLKDITNIHIKQVVDLFEMSVSKKVNLPYNLCARRDYDGIIIEKEDREENINKSKVVEEILIENGKLYSNEYINISLEKCGFGRKNIEELVYTKWLDYDKIDKLILRTRREGDYIVIDDNGKKKKLKEYFINEKIPREYRDNILLLADGSHIVWIPGYRISAYYKVTENTEHIIRLEQKKPRASYTDKE